MDVQDARRLSISAILLGSLVFVWLFFVWLADRGDFVWTWPEAALGWMPLAGWLWAGAGVILMVLTVLAMVVWGVPVAPPGMAQGSQRQVQCGNCHAVFLLHDTGHRPLTHDCPNCHSLGVYDGTKPPVGTPESARPQRIVQLDLTCQRCEYRFDVTDTGARPLSVDCPRCHAIGTIT